MTSLIRLHFDQWTSDALLLAFSEKEREINDRTQKFNLVVRQRKELKDAVLFAYKGPNQDHSFIEEASKRFTMLFPFLFWRFRNCSSNSIIIKK